jgi:curved DNA-binding protein CbpA
MKSFYEILELTERATQPEIRAAYLRLAREYHPDRVPEHLTKLRADAEEKFKQLQTAWEVLGNPEKRRRYDLGVRKDSCPPRSGRERPAPQRYRSAKDVIRDLLLRKKDFLRTAGFTSILSIILAIIGGFFISREAITRPVSTMGDQSKDFNRLTNGVRKYKTGPRRIQTSSLAGGRGLDIQLLSVAVRQEGVDVSFRVRAGPHSDFLLYEPPGSRERTRMIFGKAVAVDRNFEEIYLEDNTRAKFYSTTGLIGGRQVNFNVYNFTRRIDFRPQEEILLWAKFPPLTGAPSSIAFVSPGLGRWQPEWRWPAIDLK